MKQVLERTIENRVVKLAKERWGIISRKMNGMGFNSWPDRMFLIPNGRPLFIEFKRPGNVVTPDQAALHVRLRSAGYDVSVCDDAEQALIIIRALL